MSTSVSMTVAFDTPLDSYASSSISLFIYTARLSKYCLQPLSDLAKNVLAFDGTWSCDSNSDIGIRRGMCSARRRKSCWHETRLQVKIIRVISNKIDSPHTCMCHTPPSPHRRCNRHRRPKSWRGACSRCPKSRSTAHFRPEIPTQHSRRLRHQIRIFWPRVQPLRCPLESSPHPHRGKVPLNYRS